MRFLKDGEARRLSLGPSRPLNLGRPLPEPRGIVHWPGDRAAGPLGLGVGFRGMKAWSRGLMAGPIGPKMSKKRKRQKKEKTKETRSTRKEGQQQR